MSETPPPLPSHETLRVPLLMALAERGPLTPAQATAAVAEQLQLPAELVAFRRPMPSWSAAGLPVLQHRLRSVQTGLAERGFSQSAQRGIWDIAERGRAFLLRAKRGVVLTVVETDHGVGLWADARDALVALEDGILNMCITSPMYPGQKRQYGVWSEQECIEFLFEYCSALKPKLAGGASLFLNLGSVTLRGGANSLYKERVLLGLCDRLGYTYIQEHPWVSTSKPPTGHYVTRKRTRLKSGYEMVYQLGASADVTGDNSQLRTPYKPTMRRILARGGDSRVQRPSRHGHRGNSFNRDNGGAIPSNVFVVANASSNGAYNRYVKAHRLPPHPAAYPPELAERFIRYTTKEGDVVGDFMAGRMTLAPVCEKLKRQWVCNEIVLDYIRGGELLLRDCPGYRSHTVDGAVLLPPEWSAPGMRGRHDGPGDLPAARFASSAATIVA